MTTMDADRRMQVEELKALHDHLRAFAKLLEPICDLCLWGVELIANLRKEKEGVFIC